MAFYFENTKKDIIMTQEDKEAFKNNNTCRFCEKKVEYDKIRDHCHLTGKYRGPAHIKCNINVTQDKSNNIPFKFHIFSNYDCHMFFKNLVDKKNDKVKIDINPKTKEEYISVTYGRIRFLDSFRFLSSSVDSLGKTLVDKNHKTLKGLNEEFIDKDEILNILYEIRRLIKKYRNDNDCLEDLKKDYPEEIIKLEEVLLNYMGENELKPLKTEFLDKKKYITKN